MNIAVIPARGGSKRIPHKNIKTFCGKPMIAWPIEAAKTSDCFERIIVSTEDDEIASVARTFGGEVPFMRPSNLAGDHTGTLAVMRHACEQLSGEGAVLDAVCCIYATAPFVQPADLRAGLARFQSEDCDYVFTVTSFASPIQRALRITGDGRAAMFHPENVSKRSQDLEPAYHDAAQFYWGRCAAWLAEQPVFAEGGIPMVLPRHRVQDIDTPDDWRRAEQLFRLLAEDR